MNVPEGLGVPQLASIWLVRPDPARPNYPHNGVAGVVVLYAYPGFAHLLLAEAPGARVMRELEREGKLMSLIATAHARHIQPHFDHRLDETAIVQLVEGCRFAWLDLDTVQRTIDITPLVAPGSPPGSESAYRAWAGYAADAALEAAMALLRPASTPHAG